RVKPLIPNAVKIKISHVQTIFGKIRPTSAPNTKSIATPQKTLSEKLSATPKKRDGKIRTKIAFNSSPFIEMLFILKFISYALLLFPLLVNLYINIISNIISNIIKCYYINFDLYNDTKEDRR